MSMSTCAQDTSGFAAVFDRLPTPLVERMESLARLVTIKDPTTGEHQVRVSHLAAIIAAEMGLDDDTVEGIRLAGLVHDVGKIAIPNDLLNHPGLLKWSEFELVKQHAQIGRDLLVRLESPHWLADVVWQHHERLDGSGYPRHLGGSDIGVQARVLAVADVMEATTCRRPYRQAWGPDTALEVIKREAGLRFDSDAIEACDKIVREQTWSVV